MLRNINSLAPIVVFAYNRPRHLRLTIDALGRGPLAAASDLIVISDGARSSEDASAVDEVRQYVGTIAGFRTVTLVARPHNLGLANSIAQGVTEVIVQFGRAIVVEDDLVTSVHFLEYMNDALRLYEDDERVISVHGYLYPLRRPVPESFFIRGADCLGWATWRRGWDLYDNDAAALLSRLKKTGRTREFDWNGAYRFTRMLAAQQRGRATSWAVRWYASAFLENRLTLYPGRSLVRHIGNDNTGTNFRAQEFLDVELTSTPIRVGEVLVQENSEARELIEQYLRSIKTPAWKAAANRIRQFGSRRRPRISLGLKRRDARS